MLGEKIYPAGHLTGSIIITMIYKYSEILVFYQLFSEEWYRSEKPILDSGAFFFYIHLDFYEKCVKLSRFMGLLTESQYDERKG